MMENKAIHFKITVEEFSAMPEKALYDRLDRFQQEFYKLSLRYLKTVPHNDGVIKKDFDDFITILHADTTHPLYHRLGIIQFLKATYDEIEAYMVELNLSHDFKTREACVEFIHDTLGRIKSLCDPDTAEYSVIINRCEYQIAGLQGERKWYTLGLTRHPDELAEELAAFYTFWSKLDEEAIVSKFEPEISLERDHANNETQSFTDEWEEVEEWTEDITPAGTPVRATADGNLIEGQNILEESRVTRERKKTSLNAGEETPLEVSNHQKLGIKTLSTPTRTALQKISPELMARLQQQRSNAHKKTPQDDSDIQTKASKKPNSTSAQASSKQDLSPFSALLADAESHLKRREQQDCSSTPLLFGQPSVQKFANNETPINPRALVFNASPSGNLDK
jgi:hypothetical protein